MPDIDARLTGRYVRLRAIEPEDYRSLRQAETASPLALRWRLGGASVPPELYPDSLWNSVLAGFLYQPPSGPPGAGLITAYSADERHGFCYVAAAQLEDFGSPLRNALCTVEAVTIMIDYLFQGWPFRKIYFECADYNTDQFDSFLKRCTHEGTLRDHLYLDGRYWDLGTWAVWRDQWPDIRVKALQ